MQRLGRWFLDKIEDLLYFTGFSWQVIRQTFSLRGRHKVGYKVLVMQILFTGVNALGIISFISIALGAVIISQGISILPQFGQGSLVYTILITVITRELGPILTAFIVMARSGVAISTELGNMVVNHEIEAYVATGINPIAYLVVPRFIGVTVSVFLLNIYFNIMGLAGSYLLTLLIKSIPVSEYFGNLLAELQVSDVASSLIKSVVFGAIIALTATYYGFKVNKASTEIPVTVISAVGQGFVYLILFNVLITLVFAF
jgi:phospholipid/cholesterol/gamma-HCH transport system permease protein